jgi:catechol 2,3-dioxygenase-like lactoylglutathione lyase family enzyme
MTIRRVVPDISSERIDESRDFYVGLLGFRVVMDGVGRDLRLTGESDGPDHPPP